MKRLIPILVCLVLALSVAGCGHNIYFDSSDVTMRVVEGSVTPSGLIVCITNNTKTDICGGIEDDYSIETKENEEWSPLEEISERTTDTEKYIFQGERNLTIHWTEIYGTLPTGEYRIVKYFVPCSEDGQYHSDDGFFLTADFSIE